MSVTHTSSGRVGAGRESRRLGRSESRFVYKDEKTGRIGSVPIVDEYHEGRIVYPLAKIDRRLDKRLVRAASIAQERSHAHSKSLCWHYVKEALVASGVVTSRPKTALAKQAGAELVQSFGFKKLAIRDPYKLRLARCWSTARVGRRAMWRSGRRQDS